MMKNRLSIIKISSLHHLRISLREKRREEKPLEKIKLIG